MIQFSCADYAFPLLPRVKRFALLELLGFNHVNLGLFERSSDLQPTQLAANRKSFTRQLKSELRSTGLRLSDIFLQIGLEPSVSAANDPALLVRNRSRKIFLSALELCAAVDCAHLTGLPGVFHRSVAAGDDVALAIEEAVWRQHAASEAGVQYAVEPHIGSICFDVTSTRAFVESVPHLTLALDYGHFIASGTPSSEVHTLLPFASHIHARGAAPGRVQTSVAGNTIDFDGMIGGLHARRYRGFLVLEYVWTEWQQCNLVDNLSETILLRGLLENLLMKKPGRTVVEEQANV